jgi:hypothetical protein
MVIFSISTSSSLFQSCCLAEHNEEEMAKVQVKTKEEII